MNKKVKLTAGFILTIYCFLLFLATSPLHIYLDNKNNSKASDYPAVPFKSPGKSCPLCTFLSFLFTLATIAIFFILTVSRYRVTTAKSKSLYLPSIHYYYSQAPPVNIL